MAQQQAQFAQSTRPEAAFGAQAGGVRTFIGGLGFDPSTEIRGITELSNGLRRITLQGTRAGGVIKRATVQVDRMGRVSEETAAKARTLAQTVARNIVEVAKWSIAVGLIYGAFQRLGDLVQLAIENEVKLAEATIALGSAQTDVNSIFDSAVTIANLMGETISGVLDGYTLAVRATGSIRDETERFRIANQLLKDSLVLSKLSSLSQAEALDTLQAALKQTGGELDEGKRLLDLWVATTRVAGVNLETLAESFAITSSAAKSFKLDTMELNALISILAENTTLSATEVGNALRRILTNVQTETARQELAKFGISVTDSTGELLGFLDILEVINQQFEAGVLSDANLLQIGNAIGGGSRGGPQAVALIKNLNRVQEINSKVSESSADAYEALDIQLETVQTSIDRLGNSFASLAQTLGTDGGLLTLVGGLTDLLSGLVNVADELVSVLGDAGPILAGFGIASLISSKGFNTPLFGGARSVAGGIGARIGGGTAGAAGLIGGAAGGISGAVVGGVAAGLGTALMAGLNAQKGEFGESAGNIIGGAIGAFLTRSPIGTLIGSAIGEAFVRSVLTFDTDLQGAIGLAIEIAESDTPTDSTADEIIPRTQEERLLAISDTPPAMLKFMATTLTLLSLGTQERDEILTFLVARGSSPGQPGFNRTNQASIDEIARIFRGAEALEGLEGEGGFSLTGRIEAVQLEDSSLIAGIVQEQRDQVLQSIISGDASGKGAQTQLESL